MVKRKLEWLCTERSTWYTWWRLINQPSSNTPRPLNWFLSEKQLFQTLSQRLNLKVILLEPLLIPSSKLFACTKTYTFLHGLLLQSAPTSNPKLIPSSKPLLMPPFQNIIQSLQLLPSQHHPSTQSRKFQAPPPDNIASATTSSYQAFSYTKSAPTPTLTQKPNSNINQNMVQPPNP